MSDSINNNIPFVPENTIDPAAGLNESINTIDALLQLQVLTVGANTPPAGVEGARHIVGAAPTGVWAGQAYKLARYLDGIWHFYEARYAVNLADGLLYLRANATWLAVAAVAGSGDWAPSGGVANAYTLTPVVPATGYVTGDQFRTRFSVTNTGATTVNVSGLGTKTCVTVTGAALPAGYIRTDADTVLSYDGTNFVVDRLVERGSNANGDFIRRDDGSLECRFTGAAQDATAVSGSVFVTATPATWTFPAAYSAKPWVGYAPEETVRLGITYATSSTAANYRQMRFAASAATQTGELSAKGFWY